MHHWPACATGGSHLDIPSDYTTNSDVTRVGQKFNTRRSSSADLEDIYIVPPDVAVVSDEESAEEDEGGLTDNLSGRQLRIEFEELKVFIGILILSGYNTVPGKKRFGENASDLRNDLVYKEMRRDRFVQIMKYMRCADNTKINPNDKLFKLRPLLDKLKKKFIENWKAEQCLDYDEYMIAYFGRHSCKQFIRGPAFRDIRICREQQISEELRYDKINHLVKSTTERRRCAAINCTNRVRTMCVKCDVGLCIDCFMDFHTK
ncbi:PiggyBac transposable element-derived protein 3 [Araneus ventricosus]|uniref:PiggyBac transposable element-derived protein 3 n=1 Tax=Araneus ventricosus TaxID=182803 RepID=A0A4Y2DBL1_ARAVE|nr:PiggyBac transposable element-derived protein 3 [Araneus ventricosus]